LSQWMKVVAERKRPCLILQSMWNRVAAQLSLLFGLRRAHCRGPGTPPRPLYRPIAGRKHRRRLHCPLAGLRMDVALSASHRDRFFFSGGIVAVAYLACWIGIPEEPFTLPNAYPPGPPIPEPLSLTYRRLKYLKEVCFASLNPMAHAKLC